MIATLDTAAYPTPSAQTASEPYAQTSPSPIEAEALGDPTASCECRTTAGNSIPGLHSFTGSEDRQHSHSAGPISNSHHSPAMLPNPALTGGAEPLSLSAFEENSGTPRSGAHETPASDALLILLEDAPAPRDEWRIQEANRRLQILETFDTLVATGSSKAAACKQIGQGYATIWRWKKRHTKLGYNGLLPETDKCGRKSWLEKLGMTGEQVAALMNQVEGLNLDTESTTMALRLFANSDRCPENLARVILDPNRCSKHAIPPSIRAAATPPENARKAHRGPRTLDLKGISIPRKLDILPGDIFCPDDTTPIFGWWVPWIESEEYPFGVKLLQGQLLRIIDVGSQCPVGRVLIAREKSSYRASDIWAWVGFMADDIGIPRLGFQMERGSWDATLLQGAEIETEEGGITHSRRVGGLRQLPSNPTQWHLDKLNGAEFPKTLQTFTSYLPKTKSIEAYFDRIQTLEGCLYGSLGRDQMRKPYEKAKKLFQQCSRPGAKVDARQHFLSGLEIMTRLNSMDDFMANEPMEGEVFRGIPRVKLETALSENPLFQLPEEMRWLYRRDWKCLTITSGWARVRLTDPNSERYSLFYNSSVFAEIEGKEVAVYYDRENFEQPAQIVAASTFKVNGREYRPGDYVCEANYFERPGMFLDTDRTGLDIKKKWRNAVMTIYGRASVHAPSRQLPPEIAARRTTGANGGNREPSTINHQPSTISDGRPAAKSRIFGTVAPTEEQRQQRKNALRAEAQMARALIEE